MTRRSCSALLISALGAPRLRAAQVPRPAPELFVDMSNKRTVKLSSLRGKVVAVSFVLTT